MSKELKQLEELLANDREIIEDNYKEIERLNKKIEQYEKPEDMTLMFMWCDEKAKDEIKRLNNIINEIYTKANDTNITSLDLREYILNNLGVDKE